MVQDLRRNQRGSALIIATIMIVVSLVLIGVLLAVPQAQMAQTASSVAKQRSLENADAGAREAFMIMQANVANLQAWLPAGGNNCIVSGNASYGAANPAPAPATPTYGSTPAFFPCTVSLAPSGAQINPNGFPVFAAGNFRQFGDPAASRGQFAYCVLPTATAGYFRVLIEGRSMSSTAGATTAPLTVSSLVDLTALLPNNINMNDFGAVTFANGSGGGNPPTNAFGTPPVTFGMYNDHDRNKTYAVGGTNAGLILPQQPGGSAAPTLAYNPSDVPGSGGVPLTGTPASTTMNNATAINEYQAIANAAAAKAGVTPNVTPGIVTTSWTGPLGNTFNYYYFGPGTTINDSTAGLPFDVHSNSTGGIVFFDLGNNVTINKQNQTWGGGGGFFSGNGINKWKGGSAIFYQRGAVNVTSNNMVLLTWNSGNSDDNMLPYNSAAIQDALNTLSLPPPVPKITSYTVRQ